MYQVPNQQNKTQYLSLIDKCTQILREDRIWLRNLLKANNQDVLYLFRGLPKNLDMKQLQIRVRKFIMRTKEREKQQQLQRFKENMHLPDFIEVASQKRQEPYGHGKSQNKVNQCTQQQKGPLKETQSNDQKSSFVAKWNNYTHYNQSIHLAQTSNNRSHLQSLSSTMNRNDLHNRSLNKREWSNNYKPHSFNRNLNGELTNKLTSSKNNTNNNRSLSNLLKDNRHNKSSTSLTKENRSVINSRFQNNEEVQEMGQNHYNNYNNKYSMDKGRNSSKSLKQLENKIYEELRLFQQNKNRKESSMMMTGTMGGVTQGNDNFNKSYSQKSVERFAQKERPVTSHITDKPTTFSKENIDEILKFKLGNCDFESYRKSQQSENEEDSEHEHNYKDNQSTSQKKLYHEGLFPPIEEQTERDSESQRYPQEPMRFGMMSSKPDVNDDRHKMTFASFAKASPSQTFKSQDMSDAKMITSVTASNNMTEFHPYQPSSHPPASTFTHMIQQQPLPQKRVSQSLYQSAQKKADIEENYIQSDLHKSIMESIKKSRQMFPQGDDRSGLDSRPVELPLPVPKAQMEISSFQSSLYSSTHDQQGLFTSPELLNECRNFLKKTQEINFENSGLKELSNSISHTTSNNHRFESPHQQRSFRQASNPTATNPTTYSQNPHIGMLNFPQPITITESITKDFYESYSNSEAKINSLFESKQSSIEKGQTIEFQTYSKPEYVMGGASVESSWGKKEESEGGFDSGVKGQSEVKGNFNSNKIRKEEFVLQTHSRKNSSMKKHSEIEETMALPSHTLNLNHLSNTFNKNSSSHHQQVPEQTYAEQNFRTSEFPNISSSTRDDHNGKSNHLGQMGQPNQLNPMTEQRIEQLIDLEDVIDKILQANEGNIQVDSTWLKHTINNRHIFPDTIANILRRVFHQYITSIPQSPYNFIQIIRTLQSQYKQSPGYTFRKSPARDIYSLLDIEEKGFITFDDIQNFVTQLQSAEVDHIEEIAQYLEEVFDIADFMGVKQISYVNLYVIKNQDCFEGLWKYLQEFQFEITAEEEDEEEE